MTDYLTDIERLVRAEVNRQTADLRGELVRAQREADLERQMRSEDWRENHVMQRIDDYRQRAYTAQQKLIEVEDAVSHEGDSAWSIVDRVREIVR